jgi:hypothetical protein
MSHPPISSEGARSLLALGLVRTCLRTVQLRLEDALAHGVDPVFIFDNTCRELETLCSMTRAKAGR